MKTEENNIRLMASCIAAGQIRALADLAGVTVDIYPFLYGGKIEVTGDSPVNAFVKKASDELFMFMEGGDYAPLHEAINALKKRVEQELLRIEGFARDGEFRFINDTGGITSVPIEDGKILVRGKHYRIKKFTAYPEL